MGATPFMHRSTESLCSAAGPCQLRSHIRRVGAAKHPLRPLAYSPPDDWQYLLMFCTWCSHGEIPELLALKRGC